MQVTNWMTRGPVCVGSRETLATAKELMTAGGFRQLPVVENGDLVGMVTDDELRRCSRYLESTSVLAAMTNCPVVVTSFDSVEVAAKLLIRHKVPAIPVVENCQAVGIVTASDLLKALLEVVEAAKRGTEE